MSEKPQDFDVTALELALRELRPRSETLDRALLMYRAGRASTRGWIWPMATVATTTLAVVLGVLLFIRPPPLVIEHVVYRNAPASSQSSLLKAVESEPPAALEPLVEEPLGSRSRRRDLQIQEHVLRWGLQGIPPPPPAPLLGEAPTVEQLLHSL